MWSHTRHLKHRARKCAMAVVLFLVNSITSRALNDRVALVGLAAGCPATVHIRRHDAVVVGHPRPNLF
jgi:hypothetical protein